MESLKTCEILLYQKKKLILLGLGVTLALGVVFVQLLLEKLVGLIQATVNVRQGLVNHGRRRNALPFSKVVIDDMSTTTRGGKGYGVFP